MEARRLALAIFLGVAALASGGVLIAYGHLEIALGSVLVLVVGILLIDYWKGGACINHVL